MEDCTFSMSESGNFYVDSKVKSVFEEHGFIIVRSLFTKEEISNLRQHFEQNENIKKHAYGRSDGNERVSKVCIWNIAGNDLSGIVARYPNELKIIQEFIFQNKGSI